ncbi:MAG: cytochrome oxidase maturation protein, cbb3-type [Caulobacter sp. 39-67-4]|nr:MAG: cytochrome oxidase maturation protein, cbb3-type [Caulobacter sp. 39-67-4]
MNIILFLAPFSVGLGALGLVAFLWTMRVGQYDDPKGDAARAMSEPLARGVCGGSPGCGR